MIVDCLMAGLREAAARPARAGAEQAGQGLQPLPQGPRPQGPPGTVTLSSVQWKNEVMKNLLRALNNHPLTTKFIKLHLNVLPHFPLVSHLRAQSARKNCSNPRQTCSPSGHPCRFSVLRSGSPVLLLLSLLSLSSLPLLSLPRLHCPAAA